MERRDYKEQRRNYFIHGTLEVGHFLKFGQHSQIQHSKIIYYTTDVKGYKTTNFSPQVFTILCGRILVLKNESLRQKQCLFNSKILYTPRYSIHVRLLCGPHSYKIYMPISHRFYTSSVNVFNFPLFFFFFHNY